MKVTYSEQNLRWQTIVSSQQFAIETFEKKKKINWELINYVKSFVQKKLCEKLCHKALKFSNLFAFGYAS